jgi:hypothetical protein
VAGGVEPETLPWGFEMFLGMDGAGLDTFEIMFIFSGL